MKTDIAYFYKSNIIKIIVLLIFALLGIGLGITFALNVSDIQNYFALKYYPPLMVVGGGKGFFSYLFAVYFMLCVFFMIILLLSASFITAIFNAAIVFFYALFEAMMLTLLFRLYGVMLLLIALVGIVPFFIVYLNIFIALAAHFIDLTSRNRYCYQGNYFYSVIQNFKNVWVLLLVIFILSIIQSIIINVLAVPFKI